MQCLCEFVLKIQFIVSIRSRRDSWNQYLVFFIHLKSKCFLLCVFFLSYVGIISNEYFVNFDAFFYQFLFSFFFLSFFWIRFFFVPQCRFLNKNFFVFLSIFCCIFFFSVKIIVKCCMQNSLMVSCFTGIGCFVFVVFFFA